MANFSRVEVVQQMEQDAIVPLFYHNEVDTACRVLETCYQSGVRLLEFTNRGDKALQVFTELVSYARKNLPDMIIGVGSVIDAEVTSQFLDTGADFIVSPILDEEMAKQCRQQNIFWSPGCGTLTEIIRGRRLGADIVKLFPANQVGPEFIKAVKGPCPNLKLMPTGGISQENMSHWFKAGATCVGMGSKLIKKELVQSRKFGALQKHISSTLKLAESLQQKHS